MKTLFFFLIATVASSFSGFGQVNSQSNYANGYYRANGTFVDGYYRTTPSNSTNDNYSTYPNVSPYTGTTGTMDPTYSISNYNTQPTLSDPGYSVPTYSYPTDSYPTNSYTIYVYPSYLGISYP